MIPVIPVNIISKVEIEPISEEVLKSLIIAEIQKGHPEVVINSIEFEVKRGPTRITANVDAQLGGVARVKEVQAELPIETDADRQEAYDISDEPEPVEGVLTEEPTTEPGTQSIADIFGG